MNAQYEAAFDVVFVDEDGSVEIDVLGNDTNLSGFFDYSIGGIPDFPDHGTATYIEATETIIYEPDPNYHGPDIFTYTGCVNSGAICADADVIITVNPVPDFPIAHNDSTQTYHVTPVTVNVVANDEEFDDEGLTLSILDGGSNGNSVIVGANSIQYTPEFGFLGNDVITYQICNSINDTYCDNGTLKITVNPNNFNKPNAANDFATVYANTTISIDVVANDYDGDGDLLDIEELIPGDAFGILSITDTNTVSYISSETGVDSFYYMVCDVNAPPKCDTAMVKVTVNEAPVVLPEIHVPNSISPNNDGFNDELVLVGLSTYASFTLRIYNRWNDIVYETSDPDKVWNGRANKGLLADGAELPDGTYFYILQLQGEADPVRGFIVLKR